MDSHKQKIELAHDLIAEKIWDLLPNKRLIFIEDTIKQRQKAHEFSNGALLESKELKAWEEEIKILLSSEEFDGDSKDYINKSKKAAKQKRNKTNILILLTFLIVGSFVGILLQSKIKEFKIAEQNSTLLAKVLSEKANSEFDGRKYNDAFKTLQFAIDSISPNTEFEGFSKTLEQFTPFQTKDDSTKHDHKKELEIFSKYVFGHLFSKVKFFDTSDSLIYILKDSSFLIYSGGKNVFGPVSCRTSFKVSPNRKFIACFSNSKSENSITVYDFVNDTSVVEISNIAPYNHEKNDYHKSFSFSADSKFLFSIQNKGSDKIPKLKLNIYDLETNNSSTSKNLLHPSFIRSNPGRDTVYDYSKSYLYSSTTKELIYLSSESMFKKNTRLFYWDLKENKQRAFLGEVEPVVSDNFRSFNYSGSFGFKPNLIYLLCKKDKTQFNYKSKIYFYRNYRENKSLDSHWEVNKVIDTDSSNMDLFYYNFAIDSLGTKLAYIDIRNGTSSDTTIRIIPLTKDNGFQTVKIRNFYNSIPEMTLSGKLNYFGFIPDGDLFFFIEKKPNFRIAIRDLNNPDSTLKVPIKNNLREGFLKYKSENNQLELTSFDNSGTMENKVFSIPFSNDSSQQSRYFISQEIVNEKSFLNICSTDPSFSKKSEKNLWLGNDSTEPVYHLFEKGLEKRIAYLAENSGNKDLRLISLGEILLEEVLDQDISSDTVKISNNYLLYLKDNNRTLKALRISDKAEIDFSSKEEIVDFAFISKNPVYRNSKNELIIISPEIFQAALSNKPIEKLKEILPPPSKKEFFDKIKLNN